MKTIVDEKVVDFLKESVTHLENRISLLDNKAGILLAVQGVLIGSVTYAINEIFVSETASSVNTISFIILAVSFALFSVIAVLLLQTIRPAKHYFGFSVGLKEMKIDNYVMWPNSDFPSTPEDYLKTIKALGKSDIGRNYYKLHFNTLQLVRKKYGPYRWATLGMKLLVGWQFIGIVILSVMKLNTH